ncbi:MAG: CAP domain-containing protein [Propionibacteriales bacterium]|nr:CAP domain-containing protein [Propionibacteriales bacterium]
MRENKGRWSVKFTGATVMTMLILGPATSATQAGAHAVEQPTAEHAATSVTVAGPARVAVTAGSRVTARWSRAIDTSSKSAVNAAYVTTYAPRLTQLIDWLGGSVLGCLPGLSSASSNAGTLSSLNFVRSMAGLGPVSFSSALNSSAQRAALIMEANDALSHSPSSGWKCWTSTGAASAGRSNLAIAYPSIKAGQVIDLYMDDPGASNTAAGHRRWILNPFSTVMGTGSTRTANALTVIGPTNAYRPNPRWVGWPTAGYFPNKLEPGGRWSLSCGLKSVSFTYAKVAVYQGTTRIPVKRYAPHTGYGQPTLVWQMPSSFDKTKTYRVVVTGIKKAGLTTPLRTEYSVRLFTPSP